MDGGGKDGRVTQATRLAAETAPTRGEVRCQKDVVWRPWKMTAACMQLPLLLLCSSH